MIARRGHLFGFFVLTAIACGPLTSVDAQEKQARTVRVTIPNMHCENCAKKIRSRLFSIAGVAKITTKVKQNLAELEPSHGKTLSAFEIWDVLEKATFTPSKIVTPDAEYDEKPPQESSLMTTR